MYWLPLFCALWRFKDYLLLVLFFSLQFSGMLFCLNNWTYPPSQSATTILVLKTWVVFWPWKKIGSKIWSAKSSVQKTRSLLFKKRRRSCPLLFLNNNDPVFCTLLFAPHILDPFFFQGRRPTHDFKTRIVAADWLDDCQKANNLKKNNSINMQYKIRWRYFKH